MKKALAGVALAALATPALAGDVSYSYVEVASHAIKNDIEGAPGSWQEYLVEPTAVFKQTDGDGFSLRLSLEINDNVFIGFDHQKSEFDEFTGSDGYEERLDLLGTAFNEDNYGDMDLRVDRVFAGAHTDYTDHTSLNGRVYLLQADMETVSGVDLSGAPTVRAYTETLDIHGYGVGFGVRHQVVNWLELYGDLIVEQWRGDLRDNIWGAEAGLRFHLGPVALGAGYTYQDSDFSDLTKAEVNLRYSW